jgi:APA family basic amino acid/polyamine antiporter
MLKQADRPVESGKPDATKGKSSSFGLPAATALVVGSVIGTGVFALPSALAPYGPIAIVAFLVVTVGALALAVTFGSLSKRVPGSGGPYIYAREAFGEFAGFLTAWSYWITAWAGNAAIAVAWVGYVEVFVNTGHNKWGSIAIALTGLWIPALINLSGLRNMVVTQILTTVLKFIPLIFMATIGLLFMHAGNFGKFNASGQPAVGAISAAAAIALFSYIRPPLPCPMSWTSCCAGCDCPTCARPRPTCWPPPAPSAGIPPRSYGS